MKRISAVVSFDRHWISKKFLLGLGLTTLLQNQLQPGGKISNIHLCFLGKGYIVFPLEILHLIFLLKTLGQVKDISLCSWQSCDELEKSKICHVFWVSCWTSLRATPASHQLYRVGEYKNFFAAKNFFLWLTLVVEWCPEVSRSYLVWTFTCCWYNSLHRTIIVLRIHLKRRDEHGSLISQYAASIFSFNSDNRPQFTNFLLHCKFFIFLSLPKVSLIPFWL